MGAAIYAFSSVFFVVLATLAAAVSGHFGVAVLLIFIGIPVVATPWLLEAWRAAPPSAREAHTSRLRGRTVALFAVFVVCAIAFGWWLTK